MSRRISTKALIEAAPKLGEHNQFFMRLGSFIDMFASVETALLLVVKHYARIDADIARAILSPLRVDNAINHLHRVIEVRRLRSLRAAELENVLAQLPHINKARNDMLHMGFSRRPGTGKYVVTNETTAHARRVVRRRVVTERTLLQMTFDLVTIHLAMLSHLPRLPHAGMKSMLKEFRRRKPVGQLPAWLYRPPPQPKSRPKRHVQPRLKG